MLVLHSLVSDQKTHFDDLWDVVYYIGLACKKVDLERKQFDLARKILHKNIIAFMLYAQ